jgi:hypothetical protein
LAKKPNLYLTKCINSILFSAKQIWLGMQNAPLHMFCEPYLSNWVSV